MGRPIRDLTGQKFGAWRVIELSHHKCKNRSAYWRCKCTECGDVYDVRSDSLTRDKSHACHRCAAIKRWRT